MIYIWFVVGGFISCLLWIWSFSFYAQWAEQQDPEKRILNVNDSIKNKEYTFTSVHDVLLDFENDGSDLTRKQKTVWHIMSLWKIWGAPIIFALLSIIGAILLDTIGVRL